MIIREMGWGGSGRWGGSINSLHQTAPFWLVLELQQLRAKHTWLLDAKRVVRRRFEVKIQPSHAEWCCRKFAVCRLQSLSYGLSPYWNICLQAIRIAHRRWFMGFGEGAPRNKIWTKWVPGGILVQKLLHCI